jgi:RNA polymerase sigma-70 factor (ECF subfamily)
MRETEDITLIQEVLNGSLTAFDQLMMRYQRLVFSISRNFCKDRDHALDITQNVFLKVYQKLASLASPDQFKSWLIRITYNECISWQRGLRLHEPIEESGEMLTTPESQDQGLLHRESRERLKGLLIHLNPKHRLAVVLKYFEGMPIKEIAEILETSDAVVKNMLYRGMRRMSQQARG